MRKTVHLQHIDIHIPSTCKHVYCKSTILPYFDDSCPLLITSSTGGKIFALKFFKGGGFQSDPASNIRNSSVCHVSGESPWQDVVGGRYGEAGGGEGRYGEGEEGGEGGRNGVHVKVSRGEKGRITMAV